MNARRYKYKIEFWKSVQKSDGYGGNYTDEEKQFSKWANAKTQGAGFKFQQYGLNEFKNPVIFEIRANKEITEDMFIKFQDKKFIIKGIENVDLTNRFLNIYADEA